MKKIPKIILQRKFWRIFLNKYEIIRKIEEFAPLETQEKWDCSGWGVDAQVPHPEIKDFDPPSRGGYKVKL